MKISIIGSGYVGMSLAALLAERNEVILLDIDNSKVSKINEGKSSINDFHIENFIAKKKLNLRATTNQKKAFKDSQFIIVAAPTNFDSKLNTFDTSIVDEVVTSAYKINSKALIVIKSTLPVGHTYNLQKKLGTKNIIFSPEFLREGKSLYDNQYPSRIIIGSHSEKSKKFSKLLLSICLKKNVEILFMDSREAEAVKLFSNTFLAMRVAFFNELDTFCLSHELSTKKIIDGVCLDERIGQGYNNPSFGYGGYCLPKDTKQLLSSYDSIPQNLISSIVESNQSRKNYISEEIINKKLKTVGFYKLEMKSGSSNARSSAIKSIIKKVAMERNKVILYEPNLDTQSFKNVKIVNDLAKFLKLSDLIVTNRMCEDLSEVQYKVFTRDVYREN